MIFLSLAMYKNQSIDFLILAAARFDINPCDDLSEGIKWSFRAGRLAGLFHSQVLYRTKYEGFILT
jgi:hypothetical protein